MATCRPRRRERRLPLVATASGRTRPKLRRASRVLELQPRDRGGKHLAVGLHEWRGRAAPLPYLGSYVLKFSVCGVAVLRVLPDL